MVEGGEEVGGEFEVRGLEIRFVILRELIFWPRDGSFTLASLGSLRMVHVPILHS